VGFRVQLAAVVALAACRTAAPLPPPSPPHAEVRIATTICLPQPEVEAAITHVLAEHRADRSGLVVEIGAVPSGDAGADVVLRVVRPNGDVGLDRHYTLAVNDCASSPQLLALAVDRWLTSFPEWAEPPEPPPPQVARWLEVAASSTASAIAPPFGVEGELGGFVDFGGDRDRLGGSAWVRSGVPQHAGEGRFREIALLAGATWRHRVTRWETRLELRGGALRVNGIGFLENAASWLPWWEVSAFAGRRWSHGAVGLALAITAIRDHAVTRDGLVSEDIPLVRFGISGSFGLFGP
jgi:hypothetical protein